MAVGSLTPGFLYFLELEPIDNYGPFPFYKLGFTKDSVDRRIDDSKQVIHSQSERRNIFTVKQLGTSN